jgi:hypothetical protein
VEYHLPNSLFVKYFGEEGAIGGGGYRANFYKCADKTSREAQPKQPSLMLLESRERSIPALTRRHFVHCVLSPDPHWGCWSPVETAAPSFHQPSFFRPLRFDEATAAPGRL